MERAFAKFTAVRRKLSAVEHLPALPYAELPGLYAPNCGSCPAARRGRLELGVSLRIAQRRDPRAARWSEFDLQSRLWVVPAARMKGEREHHMFLSDRGSRFLEGLPRFGGGELIFERQAGAALGAMAAAKSYAAARVAIEPCMACAA